MPNTWEFNTVVLEPPDQYARMLAEQITNSKFPKLSYSFSKLINLYRFLDAHRNVSPRNLSHLVTEHGQPIFSEEDMSAIMNHIKLRHGKTPTLYNSVQRGGSSGPQPPPVSLRDPHEQGYDPSDDMFGATQRPGYKEAPHSIEFWEKVFNSLYRAYETSPVYLHFSEKWDGIWWYFYIMYNLEHMDIFGPYISMALDTFTGSIPSIGEAIEVVLHYGAGIAGGVLTAGLGIGPAAETGSLIADTITAYMALIGAVISISRKRTGDAFKLILAAIPFDIGTTLNMAANSIEKQYSRYLVNRARIIGTFDPVPTLQTWLDYYIPEVGEDKGPPPPPITIDAIKEDIANTVMEKTGADKVLAKLNSIRADPLGSAAAATGANTAIASAQNSFKAATTLPTMPTMPTMPNVPKIPTVTMPTMPTMPSINSARSSFAPTPVRKRGGGTRRKRLRKRRKTRHTNRRR